MGLRGYRAMDTHPFTPGRISKVPFFEFRISNFELVGWVSGLQSAVQATPSAETTQHTD